MRELYRQSKLFRLVVDEVEKTLFQTDINIAADYASLVEDKNIRDTIFGAIEEFDLAKQGIGFFIQTPNLAERFPHFYRGFEKPCGIG